ncbi:hypothetical protein [Phenylobacterium sp.]|uniref:hypothetical protein n=1 Tax=Phenylobacterium sp. TaxID=1871053 RepID=UPI0035AE37CE
MEQVARQAARLSRVSRRSRAAGPSVRLNWRLILVLAANVGLWTAFILILSILKG